MEDWTRFQTDLDFDPYLERQPETQVSIKQLITQHYAHCPFWKLHLFLEKTLARL